VLLLKIKHTFIALIMIRLRIHQETNHSGKHLVEKITQQKGHTFINQYHLTSSEISELISKFEPKQNIEYIKNSGITNISKDGPWASVQSSNNINRSINHPEYNKSGQLLNNGRDSYRNTMIQKTPMSNEENNIPINTSSLTQVGGDLLSGYDQYDSLYSSYNSQENRKAKDRDGNVIKTMEPGC